jgi:hypothetical protein
VEQAELEHARQLFEDAVRARLPGTPIDKVELLQYGDVPEIEPGELLGRVFLTLPEGADPSDMAVRRQVLTKFSKANPGAISALSKAIGGSAGSGAGLFLTEGPEAGPDSPGPLIHLKIKLSRGSSALGLSGGDQPLTAVMARLGPDDLETLDTLIAAGIASNRAEAVRWALARIRERPAYEQLRARAREIEDLKSQF